MKCCGCQRCCVVAQIFDCFSCVLDLHSSASCRQSRTSQMIFIIIVLFTWLVGLIVVHTTHIYLHMVRIHVILNRARISPERNIFFPLTWIKASCVAPRQPIVHNHKYLKYLKSLFLNFLFLSTILQSFNRMQHSTSSAAITKHERNNSPWRMA